MSYQTNTIERGTILKVQGTQYDILPAFGTYPQLTVDEYRSLPHDQWQARLNAFYDKVSAITGLDIRSNILEGQEASRVNTTGCAVNTYYRVDATAVNGTAKGGGIYKLNDSVTLKAESDTGRLFQGWFSSGVLVSQKETFGFFATQDIALEAKYSAVYSVTVNGESDFSLEVGHAGEVVTVTVESAGAGWTLSAVPSWVTVAPTSGAEGSTSVTLTVQPMTSGYDRQGAVVFKNDTELEAIMASVSVKQAVRFITVQATAYDTMNPPENHKYYGGATISQAISCPVTAKCWMQVGRQQYITYTVMIPQGATQSEWTLVYESIPDLELFEYGCAETTISECDGYSIIPVPGT